jgi:hypothetical protein
LLALIYIPVLSKKEAKEDSRPEKEKNYLAVLAAKNTTQKTVLNSYGQIIAVAQFDVNMKVQGEIDRDNRTLKPGMRFKKNEILIKVDRTEALYNLLARRSQFINLVAGVLPDIGVDLPKEEQKWRSYLAEIAPTRELPSLPSINSEKEKLLVSGRNIIGEFYSIKSAESQVEEYIYVAPFNGVIIESFVEPGSMISPGMRLITIVDDNNFEVKAPISIDDLTKYENTSSIAFTSSSKDTIGEGQFLRKSPKINTQTQSVDTYFSLNPVKRPIIGSFVNLSVTSNVKDSSIVLPEIATKNAFVQLLKDSTIRLRKIEILGTKPDSVFVKGVNDGEMVILQPLDNFSDTTKYIGIKRN